MKSVFVLVALLGVFVAQEVSGWVSGQGFAAFYGQHGCRGDRYGGVLEYSCQNLPNSLVRNWRQLSLDTNGDCVSLYDDYDCLGKEVANFNQARCRNVYAISAIKSYRKCSGRTNSAVISG